LAEYRQKKIALIGATGYEYSSTEAQVECFTWDRLKKAANLADYDVVILHLLSLEDPRSLDTRAFMDMLNVRTMWEVLDKGPGDSDSAVYVLGDPRFLLEEAPPGRTGEIRKRWEVPFLFWTGVEFKWDDRPGDTIECRWKAISGSFKPFVYNLGRWRYSLDRCNLNAHELSKFLPTPTICEDGFELSVLVEDICKSRYQTSIVFSVQIVARGYAKRIGSQEETLRLTEPIYFLPESRLSEEEMLEFVLRDLCGVDVSAPEPEWVSEFVAPGQERVDRELIELQDRIREVIEEHARKVEERAEVRKPLKLLYETGAALEESVRSVLEALGAEVERPEDRTKEDGWVTVRVGDETFEGVLEVKGAKNRHFDWEGLR
jgi:hypothetical protein